MKPIQKRLFLGNLPPKLLKRDVANMLQEFGNVQSVEMKQRTDDDGNVLSSFAFVDIEMDTEKLYSCFRRFQSESWGDHKIKVEVARESFLDRLKREQEEAKLSDTKIKKSDVNGNLDHNHSLGSYENHEQTKDHSAPCVRSKDKVEKKNSKASKVRKDLTPKPTSADDDSLKPAAEKSGDFKGVEASHEKKTRKRFGVMSMFSGNKHVKNLDDSESNVQDDSREECLQNVEEEEVEERESYGSLRMFSGTMNLKDMNANEEVKDESRSRKKRSAEVLSSPAKRHKSGSFSASSEMKPSQPINNTTSFEQPADKNKSLPADKNKFSKEKDTNLEEKRKKRSKTEKKAEEKRVNALEERNKAIHLQKEAVKKALSSVV
ncbi:hypothetical protein J437_LFUL006898 [Ladona fulva]|uniref:RRM domain-containing protein n=1 Tax=Ladona fulva TaxID=123851 RepID=A0A8K0K1Z6_LADFU|nr:hypothetical protein J437_LFUL006898 [Ladona fulva]